MKLKILLIVLNFVVGTGLIMYGGKFNEQRP